MSQNVGASVSHFPTTESITSSLLESKLKTPLFIAIDRHSAAGKSTLAKQLACNLQDSIIICMDDFYRVMDEKRRFLLDAEGGYMTYYDWQRLREEVLEPLSLSKAVTFQTYDWQYNKLGELTRLEPANFIIVEGCYSTHLELARFITFVIVVETPESERKKRQAQRNNATQEWLSRWDAAERFYIETIRLPNRANVVINTMTT
jgi:uridine kinase